MLRRIGIADVDRLGDVVHQHQSRRRQCLAGDCRTRQHRQLGVDLDGHCVEQLCAVGNQQHLRIGAVFGLRQQVGGNEGRVGTGIGDDQHLGRTGRHVDGDAARPLRSVALGLIDPGIAGAEQLVAARHRGRAQRHRGDGLRAAQLEDAQVRHLLRCDQDRRIGAAILARRRAQHDLRAARQARRNGQHQRGGGQRRAAGRHVQADALDRPLHALAQQAGRGFNLIGTGDAGAVEGLDPQRRFGNRRLHVGRHLLPCGSELVGTDLEHGQFHAIELRGAITQGRITARCHRIEDSLHTRAQLLRDRLHRAPQQHTALGVVQRIPVDPLHASILSTGSTIRPRAPARFRSSSRCQVICP